MKKYFLGSVGKAEAFKKSDSGKGLELVFVAKTLTDVGINISSQKDDIRNGAGGAIEFSFFHDPQVEITLTDIEWKKEYIEETLGAEFIQTTEVYDSFAVKVQDGAITEIDGIEGDCLPKRVQSLPVKYISEHAGKVIWATPRGTEDWRLDYFKFESEEDYDRLLIANQSYVPDGEYCIRYLAGGEYDAEVADITTYIMPNELFLIITAPLFSGNGCQASRGQYFGTLTFEVPRFQLNGNVDFQMNMSRAVNTSISGVALIDESEDCSSEDKLMRIIEVIQEETQPDDIVGIAMEEGTDVLAGEPVQLRIVLADGKTQLIQDPYKLVTVYGDPNLTRPLDGIISTENTWTSKAVSRIQGGNVFYIVLSLANGKKVSMQLPATIEQYAQGQFFTSKGKVAQTGDNSSPVLTQHIN